jgi:hypothetical protein
MSIVNQLHETALMAIIKESRALSRQGVTPKSRYFWFHSLNVPNPASVVNLLEQNLKLEECTVDTFGWPDYFSVSWKN